MNPRVAILLAALLFSTGGAAIKSSHLTAWQIASARSAIAAIVLLAVLPDRRIGGPRVWIAGAAYAATLVLFVAANKLTTAAAAIWLQATAPIHLLVLAPRLLGETIRPRDRALGGAMAVSVGLLLADALGSESTSLAPDPLLGNCLAAASGLTFALAVLAIRHEARGESGSLPVVVAGNLLAFAATAPAALAGGPPMAAPADLAGVVYLGAVQVGLAYWLLDRGIRRVPAFEASACLLVEPAMSPVWAWLATGERPGALSLAGGAAIMAATLLHASPWGRAEPG